ncbi:MAG: DUF948 domain-containing protein [Leptolyngbyaceae cyanobacterium]
MTNPILWLVLSFLLVSVSLTAVLVVLVPAVVELSRAARSVEKLCDTINRDLPPLLESVRLASMEITRLTEDVNTGVQSAGRVAQQVDQSVSAASQQAKVGTQSLMAGVSAAWTALRRPESAPTNSPSPQRTSTAHGPHATPLTSRPVSPAKTPDADPYGDVISPEDRSAAALTAESEVQDTPSH